MGKKYTKKEAVSIAISAARLYKDNFVGKRLLFVVIAEVSGIFFAQISSFLKILVIKVSAQCQCG